MTPTKPRVRTTRPDLYPIGSAGNLDPSARQGYYTEGDTEEEAIAVAIEAWREERVYLHFHAWPDGRFLGAYDPEEA